MICLFVYLCVLFFGFGLGFVFLLVLFLGVVMGLMLCSSSVVMCWLMFLLLIWFVSGRCFYSVCVVSGSIVSLISDIIISGGCSVVFIVLVVCVCVMWLISNVVCFSVM